MKIRICAINSAVVLLRYISNKDELRLKPTSLLYLVVVIIALSACHNKTDRAIDSRDSIRAMTVNDTVVTYEGDTVVHAPIAYYNFDKIKNLETFFDSISSKHPLRFWSPEETTLNEDMKECIAGIEAYRKGKRRFFPDNEVKSCMVSIGFHTAILNNHGIGITDIVYGEWFMMCAAFYSPDITCLVEIQTPDHQAGIFNLGKAYNDAPWWAYLFLKRKRGYEMIGLGDVVAARSIFQLEDKQHRKYYLCSDNLGVCEFNQWLYWAKNDTEIVKVAECHKLPNTDDLFDIQLHFDRNRLIWKYAKKDQKTGKLIAISEEPALTLLLDGENSRFYN